MHEAFNKILYESKSSFKLKNYIKKNVFYRVSKVAK